MADRKKELEQSKKAGESIVSNKNTTETESSVTNTNTGVDKDDLYSGTYEEARSKYGTGVGSNKCFMSRDAWNKGKAKHEADKATTAKEETQTSSPKSSSEVANRFADKGKTWADVKSENDNDPSKIADYLNNNPDYKPGDLTKKGMEEMGYKQDEEGKWTNDDVLDKLDEIGTETPEATETLDKLTNPETGDIDTKKANSAISKLETQLVNMGAGEFDKDGNFVLKPVGKGWETWATVLSCCLSVVGLAMGIPIMPVNFRAITGKDSKDAQIQALQQQYMNIRSDNAAKVEDVNSSSEAGKLYSENKEDSDNYGKYSENIGAYKEKSDIDTAAQSKLIDKQQEAEYKKIQAQLLSNEKIQILIAKGNMDLARLQSDLSTASAKELTEYSKGGWVRDYILACKEDGMSNKEIALAVAGINGTTPTQMGLKNAESIVDMATKTVNTVVDTGATVATGGLNKVGK